MAQTQIADIVVPAQFTRYQLEQSLVSTALFQSGAFVPNALMQTQSAFEQLHGSRVGRSRSKVAGEPTAS